MHYFDADIDAFLKAAIPRRFQDISPYEFEDFMAFLFEENGFFVEQTDYSADFGADLIVEKEGIRTAVQIKRYAASNKVGVNDINQVIGAASYYGTDQAMLITSSSITNPARQLAGEASVLIWEWIDLLEIIQDTFFDGKSFYTYFNMLDQSPAELSFEFDITSIEYEQLTHKGAQSIVIKGELTNLSEQNLYIKLGMPIYIGNNNRQYTAVDWMEDYFSEGLVFSDSKVEFAFIFLPRQMEKISKGDRIILHIFDQDDKELMILDHQLKEAEGTCFVVSFCYGRESNQYQEFISFRENYLKSNAIGLRIIRYYYQLSPFLIEFAGHHKSGLSVLKFFVMIILYIIKIFNVKNYKKV